MKMTDSLRIRTLNHESGAFTETKIIGVLCTVTDAISLDGNGFLSGGQLIVRIPESEAADIYCGDEISHDGGVTWFTVTEMRDNRKKGSSLSHRKVVGRR